MKPFTVSIIASWYISPEISFNFLSLNMTFTKQRNVGPKSKLIQANWFLPYCGTGAPENFLASQAQFSNLSASEILCHFRNYKLKVCRSNGSKLTADCHLSTFCMPVYTILSVICANPQSFSDFWNCQVWSLMNSTK